LCGIATCGGGYGGGQAKLAGAATVWGCKANWGAVAHPMGDALTPRAFSSGDWDVKSIQ